MARPHNIHTLRTPEIVDDVITRVSKGEPLASVCRTPGYPATVTWYEWLKADDELAGRFARAREAGFDAIAEEALDIADGDPGTTPQGTVDGAEVMNRKLRIETRLKLLAKWDPKRYGDKVEVGGSGKGGAVVVQVVTGVPDADAD